MLYPKIRGREDLYIHAFNNNMKATYFGICKAELGMNIQARDTVHNESA